jgi:uncharacterized membrane protein (UPF0127 family)
VRLKTVRLKSGQVSSFYNESRDVMLAEKARIAADFFSRAKGLLGSAPLADGEGLLIEPCSGIHMIGMKYAIDALFMDRQWRVVGVVHAIGPGAFSRAYRGAHRCLELPAGVLKATGTEEGDQIKML